MGWGGAGKRAQTVSHKVDEVRGLTYNVVTIVNDTDRITETC